MAAGRDGVVAVAVLMRAARGGALDARRARQREVRLAQLGEVAPLTRERTVLRLQAAGHLNGRRALVSWLELAGSAST